MNKRSELLTYMPSLDGIRALSVLAVIIYHANKMWLPGGFLGVEVFFVISGYLITLLLLAESEKNGSISLKEFWWRRARRLLPALWVVVLGVVVFAALFQREMLGTLRGDVIAALLYGFNWFQIWVGTSYFTSFEFVPLRHLWSLAVEEQFYLIWPVVMLIVAKFGKRRLPIVSAVFFGLAVVLAIYTALVYQPGTISNIGDTPNQFMSLFGQPVSRIDFLFLGTLTRSSGLLLGAALAIWWRPWLLQNSRAGANKLFDFIGIGGLAALALMMWRFQTVIEGTDEGTVGYDFLFRGGFFLTDLASLAVIAAAVHPSSKILARSLSNPVLVWLGRRSYGFLSFSLAGVSVLSTICRQRFDTIRVCSFGFVRAGADRIELSLHRNTGATRCGLAMVGRVSPAGIRGTACASSATNRFVCGRIVAACVWSCQFGNSRRATR